MKLNRLYLILAAGVIGFIVIILFTNQNRVKNHHRNYNDISVSYAEVNIRFGMETNWYDNRLLFEIHLIAEKHSIMDTTNKPVEGKALELTFYDKYDFPVMRFDPDTLSDFDGNNEDSYENQESIRGNTTELKFYGSFPCSMDKYVRIKTWNLKIK